MISASCYCVERLSVHMNANLRDECVEIHAQDLFRLEMARLAVVEKRIISRSDYRYNRLQDVLESIKAEDFTALGRLLIDNQALQAGELLISMVKAQLHKEARDQSEDDCDER